MAPLRDRILCLLCPAATSGRLPYNLAAEDWAVLKDVDGRWHGVCPEHTDAAAWVSMPAITMTRREP